MSSQRTIQSAALVKVLILEPIELTDENAESLKLRIEVFQWSSSRFTCKLWREETYLLEPTFQAERLKWDIEMCALETGLPWREIEEESLEDALNLIIQQIQDLFDVSIKLPNI